MMTAYTHVPNLELTKSIHNFLEKAKQAECIPSELKDKYSQILNARLSSRSNSQNTEDSSEAESPVHHQSNVVPTSLIRDIYHCLKDNGQKIYLHEVVQGSNLFLQSPVPSPPNPELVARLKKLRIDEENREYKRMTRNVDMGKRQFTFQDDVKSMNRQLTGVLNFILTVVAGFAFGYKAVEYSFGSNFPMQMMAGLIVGTVIFFVDLYFMVRYSPI